MVWLRSFDSQINSRCKFLPLKCGSRSNADCWLPTFLSALTSPSKAFRPFGPFCFLRLSSRVSAAAVFPLFLSSHMIFSLSLFDRFKKGSSFVGATSLIKCGVRSSISSTQVASEDAIFRYGSWLDFSWSHRTPTDGFSNQINTLPLLFLDITNKNSLNTQYSPENWTY